MRPQSAKAKGRRAQQELRDLYLGSLPMLEQDDITSRSMGSAGDDLILSPAAQRVIPFDHEVKNVESINIWAALEQVEARVRPGRIPLVAFKRNKTRMYAALPIADLISMVRELQQLRGQVGAQG